MRNETVTAPRGFFAEGVACGIKKAGALDLGLIVAERICTAAAVFTQNRFCGAPVVVGREHVRNGRLRGVVVNSGCSNVATGERGIKDARQMCRWLAELTDTDPRDVLPASTGVIGRFLPMQNIERGIRDALAGASSSPQAGERFARAIMTTDIKPKQACERIRVGKASVVVAGCCKGSGMIAPNMATMLAFLTTDAGLSAPILRGLLAEAAERTFNRVTVDECQSTSDTVAVLASGLSASIRSRGERERFSGALRAVCESLAYQIVADGEGATRVLEITLTGAKTPKDAHTAARAIAVSPLVKTAVHGGDPNWGRIVQALGTTDATFEPRRVVVRLGKTVLFRNGAPAPNLDLKKLSRMMKQAHVPIRVDLGAGKATDRVLTCDLSREYVAINADYTT